MYLQHIYIYFIYIGVCLAISSLKLNTTMNTVSLVNNNGKQTPFVRHIIELRKKNNKEKRKYLFLCYP